MVGGRSIRARRNARMRQNALERELGEAEGGPGSNAGEGGQQSPPPPMPFSPMPFSRRGRRRGRGAGEEGSVLPKLLMKVATYGIVMMALKYGKQNREGGDAGASKPQPWFIERITSILDVFTGQRDTVLLPGTQTLRVGTSTATNDDTKTTVYIVPDFLPTDTAIRWKEGARYEWARDSPAFHFVSLPLTNTRIHAEGESSATESMNATAHAARSEGQHSMARWELQSAHPLATEVTRILTKSDIKDKLVALGMEKGADMKEASVTRYSAGDFVYSAGGKVERKSRWTVIVSLADIKDGVSRVRFACASEGNSDEDIKEWCDTVKLDFNTAIVFSSNEGAVPVYEIMPNGLDGHYGVEGIYTRRSEEEAIQMEDKEL
mmetsp:Transcript_14725/g.29773  ORF Transcript_14725/g.29773 Transcript_14725/m.29773 type:complete len:378 (-) Transcript_14725:62-1195(-)